MFKRLLQLFRGKPVRVVGIGSLPEGHARRVLVGDPFAGGCELVICRVDGELQALNGVCPHAADGHFMDGPLIQGKHVYCPAHNYRFDAKTGRPVGAVCGSAKTYRVEAEGDDCLVYL
ncbi:MAG: Rieske 2Fe-2S domain-containing protein [Planctomycetes bacterium]|nr:Rieske 2Fe-2S domain-containing protein [Planctomycetota bacterium]